MTTPSPTVLSVRYDGLRRTFAAGHDVVVGRDVRADTRVAHPLISRVHLLLRFDQGRWLAIDNSSINGTFVDSRRLPVIDIHDGQTINIGNPDGRCLAFEIGRDTGRAGRPPQTAPSPVVALHEEAAPTDPQPARRTNRPRRPRPAPMPPRRRPSRVAASVQSPAA